MKSGFDEGSYLKAVYAVLFATFIIMSGAFYYIEKNQKEAIYNFVYNYELNRQKKEIKLETYAAISFIDSYTKSTIKNTFKSLAYEVSLEKIKLNPHTKSLLNTLKDERIRKGAKFVFFFDNNTSTVDFLNLNKCKPYRENLNLSFNDIHLYMCQSEKLKEGQFNETFLLATTPISDDILLGAYKPMLELENKIMEYTFPQLNKFILADKNQDSYFFVVKMLNLNGGDAFAMNIYNKSKGVSIGKPASSKGTDAKGNPYREEYLKALREKGETYSAYWYPSPTTNKPRLKISFRKYYEPLHWMIGTGFYVDSIKQTASMFADDLFRQLKYFQLLLFGLYLATMALIHLINTKFSSDTNKDTNLITSAIPHIGSKKDPIDIDKLHLKRLKTIAKALNELSTTIIDKNEQIERNRIEFLRTFVKVLEVRDFYTKGHSERVALYAQKIAQILGLSKRQQYDLYIAGLLHDLGKVAIPDSILLKPGKLSDYEYEIMKYHPVFSYELIKDVEFFKGIAKFVRQHHERCDGSGYPDGLKCEQITLEGKILAIADVFDALTTSRPYRRAFSLEESLEIIKNMPLDKTIISAIEHKLKEIYIEEKEDTLPSEMLSRVEKSRIDLFEKDVFTGLHRIKSLINFADKLIENQIDFYLFMVDIKHLKKINYIFGYQKGNELIAQVAAIIRNLKFALHPSRVGSNYFAFIYAKDDVVKIEKELLNELKDIKIGNIDVEFLTTFVHSKGSKNGEEIIYLAEMQLESLKCSSIKQR
ncbi:HD domain-containing phosphohydrolase [Hippea sp. KM1]|uniref:HD domain-containing phosphohydrolase n=1 Tax=Hippea sp. KM1 TaxID=944481 RepID=UPI00046D0A68|nr:HD domain-containing phosphohydrolase [Hippea sp. KM1]